MLLRTFSIIACVLTLAVPHVAAAPPHNDDRADAALLLLHDELDTREATLEEGEFGNGCGIALKTVWYRIVVVTPVAIDTAGSNYPTTVTAFVAGTNDMVACDENAYYGYQSSIELAIPGVYDVQIGEWAAWSLARGGDLVVDVQPLGVDLPLP